MGSGFRTDADLDTEALCRAVEYFEIDFSGNITPGALCDVVVSGQNFFSLSQSYVF